MVKPFPYGQEGTRSTVLKEAAGFEITWEGCVGSVREEEKRSIDWY